MQYSWACGCINSTISKQYALSDIVILAEIQKDIIQEKNVSLTSLKIIKVFKGSAEVNATILVNSLIKSTCEGPSFKQAPSKLIAFLSDKKDGLYRLSRCNVWAATKEYESLILKAQ